MAAIPFKHWLHDDYDSGELVRDIFEQTGIEMTDQMRGNMGRPFYEVTLNCTIDDETGEVKLVSAAL